MFRDEARRVETKTKLANHADVGQPCHPGLHPQARCSNAAPSH